MFYLLVLFRMHEVTLNVDISMQSDFFAILLTSCFYFLFVSQESQTLENVIWMAHEMPKIN